MQYTCLLLLLRCTPRPALFPYTTLFRSNSATAASLLGAVIIRGGRSSRCLSTWVDTTFSFPRSFWLRAPYRSRHQVCGSSRSEEHTSELQSRLHLVCRLLLEKKKNCHTI